MAANDPRGPIPIAELVRSRLPSLGDLSDEEWARRDAEVHANARRDEERRRDAERSRIRDALIAVGLSAKHMAEVLDAPPRRTLAVEAVTAWMGGGIRILAGGVGCGKTTAAHAWLLPEGGLIEPHRIAFVSAHEFARTSRYDGKFERLEDPIRLVLDDLGVEYLDERGSALSDLDELLDSRMRAGGRGTLLTTNLSAEKFRARYGARIASRVREGGAWINVDGPDLRTVRP